MAKLLIKGNIIEPKSRGGVRQKASKWTLIACKMMMRKQRRKTRSGVKDIRVLLRGVVVRRRRSFGILVESRSSQGMSSSKCHISSWFVTLDSHFSNVHEDQLQIAPATTTNPSNRSISSGLCQHFNTRKRRRRMPSVQIRTIN